MLRFMENKKRNQKLQEDTYDDDELCFSKYEVEDNIIPQITQALVENFNNKPRKNKIQNRDRKDLKNFGQMVMQICQMMNLENF